MKKTVLIIAFLFISTLVFSFNTDNVEGATGDVTLVDWDDGVVGETSGTFGQVTLENTLRTDIDIDNSYTYSDNFQLLHHTADSDADNEGYINLTQSYDYMSEIVLYVRFNGLIIDSVYNHNYLHFMNDSGTFFTLKSSISSVVTTFKLYIVADAGETLLWDIETDHPVSADWDTDTDIKYKIVITHITSNLMNFSIYNMDNGYLNGFEDATLLAFTWESFDSLRLAGGAHNGVSGIWLNSYYDDIIISTTGGSEDAGNDEDEIQGYTDDETFRCTSMDREGIFPFRFDQLEQKYLEIGFQSVTASYRIKAVDLYVADEQLSLISDELTEYDLKINGVPVGNPDYFIPVGNDMYKIRWMVSVELFEETPIFEFKSNSFYSQSGYSILNGIYTTLYYNWYLPFTTDNVNIRTGIHNYASLWGNQVVDHYAFFNIANDGVVYDAIMCYYYDDVQPIEVVDRVDYIDTDKATYLDTNENINIFGTSSNLVGTTLHVYDTDTDEEVTYYGLPYVVDKIDFDYNGKLLLAGNYNATLERGGLIVASADFEILTNTTDYWMSTQPNPSDDADAVTLYYLFNHSNASADAKIVLSYSQYLTDTYAYMETWYKPTVIIGETISTIDNIVIDQEGLYYFIMAVETQVGENTYWTAVNVYEHVTKTKEYENKIDILTPEVDIGDTGFAYATVQYTHNHLGCENIFLYLNGIETVSLKDNSMGTYSFKITKAGYYNVSLVFIEDDGDIVVLDTGKFEATYLGEIPVIPTTPLVPTEYNTYIIMLIIGIFAIIPISFMAKFGVASIFVEPVFISLGIAVCIMLGLIELWLVLFIIFIITATIVGWLIWGR